MLSSLLGFKWIVHIHIRTHFALIMATCIYPSSHLCFCVYSSLGKGRSINAVLQWLLNVWTAVPNAVTSPAVILSLCTIILISSLLEVTVGFVRERSEMLGRNETVGVE